MPAFKKIALVALLSLSKVNAFPTRAGLRNVNIEDTLSRIEDLRERIDARVTEPAGPEDLDEGPEAGVTVTEEFLEGEINKVIVAVDTMDEPEVTRLQKAVGDTNLDVVEKDFTPEEKVRFGVRVKVLSDKITARLNLLKKILPEVSASEEFEKSNDEGPSEFGLEMAELDIVIGEVPTMDTKQLKGLSKSLQRMSLSEYEEGFSTEEKDMFEKKLKEIQTVIENQEPEEPEDELMEIGASEEFEKSNDEGPSEFDLEMAELDIVIGEVPTMDKKQLKGLSKSLQRMSLSEYEEGFSTEEKDMFEKKLKDIQTVIENQEPEDEGLDELDELVLSLKGKLNN